MHFKNLTKALVTPDLKRHILRSPQQFRFYLRTNMSHSIALRNLPINWNISGNLNSLESSADAILSFLIMEIYPTNPQLINSWFCGDKSFPIKCTEHFELYLFSVIY